MFHYQGHWMPEEQPNLSLSNLQSSSTNDFSYTSTAQVHHRPQYKRNLKTMLQLYGYYMTQTFENYLEFAIAVLLIGIMILVSSERVYLHYSSSYRTSAQRWKHDNPNVGLSKISFKGCDSSIMKGDTIAALRQINLAEIQLSLLNMGSQGTSMNASQAIEFVAGGSLSSTMMAANCIIDNQAMARCMR